MNSAGPTELTETPSTADGAAAAGKLQELLNRVEQLAPLLPQAALLAAAARLRTVAIAAHAAEGALEDDSPLRIGQLSYAGQDSVLTLDGGERNDETGSVGSADAGDTDERLVALGAPHDDDEEEPAAEGVDLRAEAAGAGDEAEEEPEPDPMWAGVDPWNLTDDSRWVDAGFDSGEGAGVRDTRLAPHAPHEDPLALARHGRTCLCDYHDLGGQCANACMAVDMLQQRRLAALVAKHQALRRRRPHDDQDGREARHAMYKEFVAWQFSNPLGAEQRVRIPYCVMFRVRKLFPTTRAAVRGATTWRGVSGLGTTPGSPHGRRVACAS
eukprot:3929352-Prymnesium_polylepis.1